MFFTEIPVSNSRIGDILKITLKSGLFCRAKTTTFALKTTTSANSLEAFVLKN